MEIHSRNIIDGDFRSFGKLLCTMVLFCGFSVFASDLSGHPEGGDGRGLSVKLDTPWTTFAAGERFSFTYTLANAGDTPAVVAIPVVEYGFGWPTGGQPYLDAKWQPGRGSGTPEYDIRKAVWPPRGMEGNEPQTWGELPPGQKITWNQNQVPPSDFGVICSEGLEAVQAHWLVGQNRWISSEPVSVRIVNVPRSDRQEVSKINWSSYGYGKDNRSAMIYRISLEDKMYLFVEGRYRVTEVAQRDEFEFQIDKEGTNLEITIRNGQGNRKVYYHLRHGITRDTPWPIGPVKLFAPKPEPIPSNELEALRKVVYPSPAIADRRPNKKIDSKPPARDHPASAQDDGKGAWSWIMISLVAFVVTLLLVILRKLRQGASINRDENGKPQP